MLFFQVRVRIGYPITGYGQESRNRAARQRIPNRTWTDEDGVEHVEVITYKASSGCYKITKGSTSYSKHNCFMRIPFNDWFRDSST